MPGLSEYLSHGANLYSTELTGAELDYDQAAFRLALPVNYNSVLPECKYSNGKLTEVILDPLDFGYDLPQSQRGIPCLAHGGAAQRILERLQKISKPFGTQISIQGEVGIVRAGEIEQSKR